MDMTLLQRQCLALIRANMADPKIRGEGWLPPSFVAAHIEIESGWRPAGRSSDGFGSIGLMQCLPATARQMGVFGDQREPGYSILAGMRYLAACRAILWHHYGHPPDYRLVCAAFNEGPGNVERGRPDSAYVERWTAAQAKWAAVDGEPATRDETIVTQPPPHDPDTSADALNAAELRQTEPPA